MMLVVVVFFFLTLAQVIEASERSPSSSFKHFPLISHRQQLERRRRLRRLASSKDQDNTNNSNALIDAPLYQGIGTHYIDLFVGTPHRQRQTLIVDTGSEWTAFPCVAGCCGQQHHTDDEFDPDQSDTFFSRSCQDGCQQQQHSCSTSSGSGDDNQQQQCQVHMRYQEGSSWTAYEAQDQVSLGTDADEPSFPLRFGCQTHTTKWFRTQLADGIMGMYDGPLSIWRQAGFDSFSLCFLSAANSALQDSAGVLTLGGHDNRLLLGEMQWAKRVRTGTSTIGSGLSRYFDVAVTDLYFESNNNNSTTTPLEGFNAEMMMNQGGVILDSGTTDTFLAASVEESFRQGFHRATGGDHVWSNRLRLTLAEVEALPTLVVQLEGYVVGKDVKVLVPPLHYFEHSQQQGKQGNMLFEPSIFFEGYRSTLGANLMQGQNIHFGQDKIGFAPSDCNYEDVQSEQQQQQQQAHSIKIEVPDVDPAEAAAVGAGFGILVVAVAVVGAIGSLFMALKRSSSNNGSVSACTTSSNYTVVGSTEMQQEIELI